MPEQELILPVPRRWWSVPDLTRALAAAFLATVAFCSGVITVSLSAAIFVAFLIARNVASLATRPRSRSSQETES